MKGFYATLKCGRRVAVRIVDKVVRIMGDLRRDDPVALYTLVSMCHGDHGPRNDSEIGKILRRHALITAKDDVDILVKDIVLSSQMSDDGISHYYNWSNYHYPIMTK